jgi:hypothetical protein
VNFVSKNFGWPIQAGCWLEWESKVLFSPQRQRSRQRDHDRLIGHPEVSRSPHRRPCDSSPPYPSALRISLHPPGTRPSLNKRSSVSRLRDRAFVLWHPAQAGTPLRSLTTSPPLRAVTPVLPTLAIRPLCNGPVFITRRLRPSPSTVLSALAQNRGADSPSLRARSAHFDALLPRVNASTASAAAKSITLIMGISEETHARTHEGSRRARPLA